MRMSIERQRVQAGTPQGGEFSTHNRPDGDVTLNPGLSVSDLNTFLDENGLELPAPAVEVMLTKLSAVKSPTVLDKVDAYRAAREEYFGVSDAEHRALYASLNSLTADGFGALSNRIHRAFADGALRDPDSQTTTVPIALRGTPEFPVPNTDPAVQAGEVFDTVLATDETIFHRFREGVMCGDAQAIRIQSEKALTDSELQHFGDIAKYALAQTVRGELLSDPERDSPYSFTFGYDTTKGNQGRSGQLLMDIIGNMIRDGSKVRVSSRQGAGTIGTRAIEPMNSDRGFEMYFDDVWGLR